MKNFDSLTMVELAALTHEEVMRYINIACAEAGIPLVPELPPKPVEPIVESDVELFEVAGHVVATMEEAETIQKVFNRVVTYEREYSKSSGNLYVYVPEERTYRDPSTIKPVKAMSDALYIHRQKDIEAYNTAKSEYERIDRKFSSIKKHREDTEKWYWDMYHRAVEWTYEREQLKKLFVQYLELADGNRDIAWNFFVKANEGAEEMYPGLKDELFNEP